jgi:hypothetical protein
MTRIEGYPDPNQTIVLYDSGNVYTVGNGPTNSTLFITYKTCTVTKIRNYHWNDGKGAIPGTISLQLQGTGTVYGPWSVTGQPGQGGVPNANWDCEPNQVLPPGIYIVVDSDPATWAQNNASGNIGMTQIFGQYAP